MKLYHHPGSSNSRRVRLVAHALGQDLELEFVDLMDPQARRRLEEMNANSKVPVLQDGDFLLSESYAIISYLCERTPGQTLLPSATRARADVQRWLFWCAQHWAPAISTIVWENLWKGRTGNGPADLQELARGAGEFTQFATVLNAHLAERDWVCGSQSGLADYALAAPLMDWKEGRLPLPDYPHIQAWLERVQATPAWQATA